MEERFYMLRSKMNAAIAETILEGNHIKVEGYVYEEVSRKPKRRQLLRTLQNHNLRFLIYS